MRFPLSVAVFSSKKIFNKDFRISVFVFTIKAINSNRVFKEEKSCVCGGGGTVRRQDASTPADFKRFINNITQYTVGASVEILLLDERSSDVLFSVNRQQRTNLE